jgi:hypothetical protein
MYLPGETSAQATTIDNQQLAKIRDFLLISIEQLSSYQVS